MASGFAALPIDIRALVCEYFTPKSNPSVYEFALIDRGSCAASNRHRFRRLRLIVETPEKLVKDTQSWEAAFQNRGVFTSIRRLTIDGVNPVKPNESNPEILRSSADGDDLACTTEHLKANPNSRHREHALEDPDSWKPLAELLCKLSGLEKLVWFSWYQFPPCLLEVLHQRLPNCRLNNKYFRLDSLRTRGDRHRDIDQHEYALATSPSLSSLTFYFRSSNVWDHYIDQAVMQMAAGSAPNLTEVYMVYNPLASSHFFPEDYVAEEDIPLPEDRRDAWKRFFANQAKEKVSASHLQVLSISPAYPYIFQAWDKHILFSKLRVLQLWGIDSAFFFDEAQNYQFTSLKALVLQLEPDLENYWDEGGERPCQVLDSSASDFLEFLPALECLHLETVYVADIEVIELALQTHGDTLRKFSLRLNYLGINWKYSYGAISTMIKDIGEHCPNLRDLTISIPRTQGDKHEVEIYRALSTIHQLEALTIYLAWDINTSFMEIFLMNLAVDEALVRQIFSVVVAQPALERLKVDVRPRYREDGCMIPVVDLIKGTWEAVRLGDGLVVHPPQGWVARHARTEGGAHLLPCDDKAFHELWPSKGGNWRQDWHSFPLESD